MPCCFSTARSQWSSALSWDTSWRRDSTPSPRPDKKTQPKDTRPSRPSFPQESISAAPSSAAKSRPRELRLFTRIICSHCRWNFGGNATSPWVCVWRIGWYSAISSRIDHEEPPTTQAIPLLPFSIFILWLPLAFRKRLNFRGNPQGAIRAQ